MNDLQRRPLLASLTLVAAALAACASAPPRNLALEDAHLAYDRAAVDPDAVRTDPADLDAARQALAAGDEALRKGASDVDHYAYLARQRVASAVQAGAAARSDQITAGERQRRDDIVIAARTREAETQRANAAVATADAAIARQQADDARTQLALLQAQQTDRGMVMTMGDVLFDSGKSTLKSGAMQTVDRLAQFLSRYPAERIRIEGYTDSVGSEDLNLDLSRRRANAVRDALLDRGVDSQRITVAALGERYAVASNADAAGRQLNRRVEVVFSDPGGAFGAPRS